MRRLAQGLVVAGLLVTVSGEFLVILDREAREYQEMAVAPRDTLHLAQAPLSIWSAIGTGTAISATGLLILALRPLAARLRRRRISSRWAG
jgi:hypothetical protein